VQLSPANVAPGNNVGYQWIKLGVIYPYVSTVAVYHCPADNTSVSTPAGGLPRVRSMSMNAWMNPIAVWGGDASAASTLYIYRKETDLIQPGPSSTWVFIDENPAGINDGSFISDPDPAFQEWIDYPAYYHNNAGGLAFGDGHAEIHKWRDGNILKSIPQTGGQNQFTPEAPPTGDLTFLRNASSARR
jgi:prepilin-type processing-associated H-X9-DG protein